MNKTLLKIVFLVLITSIIGCSVLSETITDKSTQQVQNSPKTLREKIAEKNKQLKIIQEQKKRVLSNLEKLGQEKRSLNWEIKTNNYQINQLNLEIKSSEIQIEKLKLEIESLKKEIADLDKQLDFKKQAIKELLQQLQQNDQQSLLIIFLKNQTLAENTLEIQRIIDFNYKLFSQLFELRNLRREKINRVNQISTKQKEEEWENFNLRNRKLIVLDQKRYNQILLEKTKNQERLYQKQLQVLKKIYEQTSREIEQIEKELRKKIDPKLLPQPRPGVLLKPVNGPLTQGYGYTKFARTHYKQHRHNGIDIGAPIGTPIRAAEEGKVIAIGNQDKYCWGGAYGKFVAIEHPNNLITLYAHLARQIVKEGDIIKRGQVIGYVGNTGYSTGPHLHFGVYAGPTFYIGPSTSCGPMPYGGDLNPLDYIEI